MHITSIEHRLNGSYAIVGAHLPIACGLAWAAKIRRTGQVAVCFFGDETTSIGAFHEAVNLAAVWRLPVVFVWEIVSPAGPAEAFGLLAGAIRDDNPVLVFEDEALYGRREPVPDGEHVLPLGQARTVRAGNDVTLVGLSITVGTCLAAAGELAAQASQPTCSTCAAWSRLMPPRCSPRSAAPGGWWWWKRTRASSAGARPSRPWPPRKRSAT